jgi:hypothetical protein
MGRLVERVYTHIDGDYEMLQRAAAQISGLNSTPTPLPSPVDGAKWQELIATKYRPRDAQPAKAKKVRDPRERLTDAETIAWTAYQFAIKERPDLKADYAAYEWLIGRREFTSQLPPTMYTFRRYLHRARIHHFGMSKRKLRRAAATKGVAS